MVFFRSCAKARWAFAKNLGLEDIWDNFWATSGQLWDDSGGILRQLWDNLGQLSNNFGTFLSNIGEILGQLLTLLLPPSSIPMPPSFPTLPILCPSLVLIPPGWQKLAAFQLGQKWPLNCYFHDKCVIFAHNCKYANSIQYNMQYTPCNNALIAHKTLLLSQKNTFLPKDFQVHSLE